jgi:hypothetical protein
MSSAPRLANTPILSPNVTDTVVFVSRSVDDIFRDIEKDRSLQKHITFYERPTKRKTCSNLTTSTGRRLTPKAVELCTDVMTVEDFLDSDRCSGVTRVKRDACVAFPEWHRALNKPQECTKNVVCHELIWIKWRQTLVTTAFTV